MASLSRSLSLPPRLKPKTCELEDLILTRCPPSSFQTGDMDDAESGKVVIKHFWDDHPLILSTYVKENVDKKKRKCLLCNIYFTWGTPIYTCSKCSFFLHKWCALLHQFITNSLHPEHLLAIDMSVAFKCCKCGEAISGLGYDCIVCRDNFKLHVKCALQDIPISVESTGKSSLSRSLSFPLDSKQNSPILFSDPRKLQNVSLIISSFSKFQINAKIRHFSHKHPLVLMIYFEKYRSKDCILCGMELLPDVLSYGCAECYFFIHESCCKKLPQIMRNTLHPAHLLERTSLKTKTLTCICAKEIYGGIGYYCALCDFSLHCECASTHNFKDHKEHKFIYLKASLFTCDACGVTENKECVSCVCTGCHLQVHKKCSYSPFPRTVKQRRHHHKLRLTYFFESTDVDFADRMCMICFNKINNVYCMYQCTKYKCAYITHVACSISKDILIYKSDEIEEEEFIPSTLATTADFLTSISQTLPLLSSPSLDAFIVQVGNRYKFCTPHLDLCVQFAMRKKNIKCFEIDTDPRDSGLGFTAHYNLPAVFYVWIKSPDGLDSISSLTSVSLNQVNVSDDLIQHLLVNCPLLESLRVVDSRELLNPKFIGGPTLKLKYLEIFGIYLESVELCTPNLVSFTANNEKVKLHIKNAPKLVELSISVGVVNERPESVSSYLPHLERLTLDFSILNHTFKTQLMHQFDELNRLQHLTWKLGKYWHELTIKLNSMLEASPFLHKFTLVNSLDMVRTLHIVPNVTAKHAHRCLKVLEIDGFCGVDAHVKLVKYFLKNTTSLEEIILDTRGPYLRGTPWEGSQPHLKQSKLAALGLKKYLPPRVSLVVLE